MPIILSLNIQSLQSKHADLKIFLADLLSCEVCIDLIIMQEIWNVNFPELLTLPGFQNLVFQTRKNMRGGGVGIYVRNGLNFKIRNDLSLFKTKIFENMVLELKYPKQSIFISNIYHSPNPPNNYTLKEHSNEFLEKLDDHLSCLSNLNKDVYVFTDSNIDLLKLSTDELCNDYMDLSLGNGFVQLICRATRIQGQQFSLIDHIFANSNKPMYHTGTILSDLSDHFINFIQLPLTNEK